MDQRKILALFLAGIGVGLALFAIYSLTRPAAKPGPVRPAAKPTARRPVIKPAPPPEKPKPKVAIVLDDFGYNQRNMDAIFAIKAPVTFSILPRHPYSKRIAELVHQKCYEAILHLPLEPYETDRGIKPEKVTITTAMTKEEIIAALNGALESVSYAKGASNHQGSKATGNYELMKVIFTELRARNMYFLDSLVTDKSVCKRLAKETGIGFARRDVFLDNKVEFEYIKGQFGQLVKKARRAGSAIGIGHDREKTVAALAVLMPEAQKDGIEFVFLSELIK